MIYSLDQDEEWLWKECEGWEQVDWDPKPSTPV